MSDKPKKLTAKVGAYSSIVGGGVHIHEPDGRLDTILLHMNSLRIHTIRGE